MLKKLNMSKIMKEAHELTRKIKEQYPEVDYQFQLSLCLKYLIEEYREMNVSDFIKDYEQNYKKYNYILYHNDILVKNGKITESQEKEQKNTSAFYKILHSHKEDIEQLTLLKIIEYFNKHGNVKYKDRFRLYGLMAFNAIKQYSRQLKRFNSYTDERYINVGWCGDVLSPVYYDEHNFFDIDIKNMLSSTQNKIIKLLKAGYTKVEIADILRISRQAVYKNIERIRKELKEYYNIHQ